MYIYLARFLSIVTAICAAYLLYYKIANPYFFIPRGISNTNNSVQIEYYTQGNTVLFNIIPSGIWVWYNGTDAYVYGHPMDQSCIDNINFEASYRLDKSPNIPSVYYTCTTKLDTLFTRYKQLRAKYIFHSLNNPAKFSANDAMNLLLNKGIISS
jgi:hypothetical protein